MMVNRLPSGLELLLSLLGGMCLLASFFFSLFFLEDIFYSSMYLGVVILEGDELDSI